MGLDCEKFPQTVPLHRTALHPPHRTPLSASASPPALLSNLHTCTHSHPATDRLAARRRPPRMSDLLGCLTDELGGADEALALAAHAQKTSGPSGSSYSGAGMHAANPLLKRSRLYYRRREESLPVGLDNQSADSHSRARSLHTSPAHAASICSAWCEHDGACSYVHCTALHCSPQQPTDPLLACPLRPSAWLCD